MSDDGFTLVAKKVRKPRAPDSRPKNLIIATAIAPRKGPKSINALNPFNKKVDSATYRGGSKPKGVAIRTEERKLYNRDAGRVAHQTQRPRPPMSVDNNTLRTPPCPRRPPIHNCRAPKKDYSKRRPMVERAPTPPPTPPPVPLTKEQLELNIRNSLFVTPVLRPRIQEPSIKVQKARKAVRFNNRLELFPTLDVDKAGDLPETTTVTEANNVSSSKTVTNHETSLSMIARGDMKPPKYYNDLGGGNVEICVKFDGFMPLIPNELENLEMFSSLRVIFDD